MKNKLVTAMFALVLTGALIITGCNLSANSSTSDSNESDDESNSGNSENGESDSVTTLSTVVESDELMAQTSDIVTKELFTDRDLDTGYDEANSTIITLSGSSISVFDESVTVDGTRVTITEEGTYVFKGTLSDGQIVVDTTDDSDKVQIVLDGVDITNDDGACIYIKSADKVFITLADGTENILSDTGNTYATNDSDANVDGVIFAKDDITFNGNGTLTINAGYSNAIVGKDDLKFTGGSYILSAANNAIEANDSVRIKAGSFTIVASGDGIQTDNEDEEDKGYVYIEGGDINITSDDDGIHAATALIIEDGTINIVQSYEGLEGDTIDIFGGSITVCATDDGLNASTTKSSTSSDNTANTALMDSDPNAYINIAGGTVYINASGDGIDSNGELYICGGDITVDGPTDAMNGAIDYGTGATILGGTLIAVGSSGMNVSFSQDSTQNIVLYTFEKALSKGTTVTITDVDGKTVMSYTLTKTAQSIYYSSDNLTSGNYTITAGDESGTFTVEEVFTSAGSTKQMMGAPGQGQGPMIGEPGGEGFSRDSSSKDMSSDGQMEAPPDGSMPQMPSDGQAPPSGMEPSGGNVPQGGLMPNGSQQR